MRKISYAAHLPLFRVAVVGTVLIFEAPAHAVATMTAKVNTAGAAQGKLTCKNWSAGYMRISWQFYKTDGRSQKLIQSSSKDIWIWVPKNSSRTAYTTPAGMTSSLYFFVKGQCYRTTVYNGSWGKPVKTIQSPTVRGK